MCAAGLCSPPPSPSSTTQRFLPLLCWAALHLLCRHIFLPVLCPVQLLLHSVHVSYSLSGDRAGDDNWRILPANVAVTQEQLSINHRGPVEIPETGRHTFSLTHSWTWHLNCNCAADRLQTAGRPDSCILQTSRNTYYSQFLEHSYLYSATSHS